MEKKKNQDLEKILDELNSKREKHEKAEEPKPEPEKFILAEEPDSPEEETLPEDGKYIAVAGAEEIPPEEEEIRAENAAVEEPRGKRVESFPSGKNFSGKKRKLRISKKERNVTILGLLVTVFVIIGLVTTIKVGYETTRDIISQKTRKEELAMEIFPLVIVDIPEFEDPKNLDNSAIIASSIWALIVDEEDKSKYPTDDLGAMYIPDADVEVYIRKLFGSEVPIKHQTVDNSSVQMIYDLQTKTYVVDSTPKFLPYTPRIDKISTEGDIYTLQVSYILPDAMWNMNTGREPTVDKIMEYRLKRSKESYQMLSVKILEVTGVSSAGDVSQDPLDIMDESSLPEDAPSEETSSGGEVSDTTQSE